MLTTRRRFVTLASGSLAAGGLLGSLAAPASAAADDGAPNVFFSPHGQPFRAPVGAPYPVVDWFRAADRNGDGKLDRDEFVADAAAFFTFLDLKGDGVLDSEEISFYEHRIAPEVLGMRVTVYANGQMRIRPGEPRLWLAQFGGDPGTREGNSGPMDGGPFGQDGQGQGPGSQGGPGQTAHGGDLNEGQVVPRDALPEARPKPETETSLGTGASPFGLFRIPEPVTAADADYVVNATVRKSRFLAHARENFAALDPESVGYLTLASLPQSPVEKLLGPGRRVG
jgi:hypothetical protein